MDRKYVYLFGGGCADGRADMKNLLGGKGANLAEMASLGIPVPAGFTITTEMCTVYYDENGQYPPELGSQVDEGIAHIEKIMGSHTNVIGLPVCEVIEALRRVGAARFLD